MGRQPLQVAQHHAHRAQHGSSAPAAAAAPSSRRDMCAGQGQQGDAGTRPRPATPASPAPATPSGGATDRGCAAAASCRTPRRGNRPSRRSSRRRRSHAPRWRGWPASRCGRRPGGAGCPARPPRSPGPGGRSARPAAAAARSSGRRARSRRVAPGRRTGRSRPPPPPCPAPPAARRRSGDAGVARGSVQLGVGGVVAAETDVVADRAGEQHRALADPGGHAGQRLRHHCGDVGAVDQHAPGRRLDEAEQHLDDGRFAGAGRPGQHQRLPGWHAEAHILQGRAAGGVPGEADMLERDGDAAGLHGADGGRGRGLRQCGQVGQVVSGAAACMRSW